MSEFHGFYSAAYRLLVETPGILEDAELGEKLRDCQIAVPSGEKHWECVTTGLLHLALPDEMGPLAGNVTRALHQLLPLMASGHHAANWRLMRHLTVCATENRPIRALDLGALDMRQEPDGFLPDAPDDQSTQYHAYIALLLARFGSVSDSAMRELLGKALQWLLRVFHEDGDANGRGRGRLQLFGYASMWAFAQWAERKWHIEVPKDWSSSVLRRLKRERQSGAIPLWWRTPVQHELILGYNSVADYPAFADFWTKQACERRAVDRFVSPQGWRVLRCDTGSAVIFDALNGPVLAIQPWGVESARPLGVRESLASLSRALRRKLGTKERTEDDSSVIAMLTDVPNLTSWRIQATEGGFLATWELKGALFQRAPLLWVRSDYAGVHTPCTQGSLELFNLNWNPNEPQSPPWAGVSVLAVRSGKVQLSLRQRTPV